MSLLPTDRNCAEHRNGKVLLGSPLPDITLLHHAEHLADVPDKPTVRYHVPIIADGQRTWVEIEEFDTNRPIGNWDGEGYFTIIAREALHAKIGRAGPVGAAVSFFFDAEALKRLAIQWPSAPGPALDGFGIHLEGLCHGKGKDWQVTTPLLLPPQSIRG
jgi:hypothetical protein